MDFSRMFCRKAVQFPFKSGENALGVFRGILLSFFCAVIVALNSFQLLAKANRGFGDPHEAFCAARAPVAVFFLNPVGDISETVLSALDGSARNRSETARQALIARIVRIWIDC